MDPSRRYFLRRSAAYSAGFAGLHALLASRPSLAALVGDPPEADGPGLRPDPKGVIDLPEGFTYSVVSRRGGTMSDGLLVPGQPDGMACFPGEDGLAVIVCNHELSAAWREGGPFGAANERIGKIDARKVFDVGRGGRASIGGTTTILYDVKEQRTVRQFLSLAGTNLNCAGGLTPWGSWLSCEEDESRAGDDTGAAQDHGWVFEVPASARGPVEPLPIRAMGRFRHEAVCVDPGTGIVYLTEDKVDGILYRFIPEHKGRLHAGGRLQALVLRDAPGVHTGNQGKSAHPTPPADAEQRYSIARGTRLPVKWIDLDEIHSPKDDLRLRGTAAGAAVFARNEGMWWGGGRAYFTATLGGRESKGQLWRYEPSPHEGAGGAGEETSPGHLELFLEPDDSRVMLNPDNITVTPWGDLIVCEDSFTPATPGTPAPGNRLLRVTPAGEVSTLARNAASGSEFAGACFSPDGSTLFVNIQGDGLTLAVRGPW